MTILDDMRRSGWHPGRSVDPSEGLEALRDDGFTTWPELVEFLREFSGLEFVRPDVSNAVLVDAAKATRDVDPVWGQGYSRALQVELAPVAQQSAMTIYLTRKGDFIGGFDHSYGHLGTTFPEALTSVLYYEPGTPGLDRELPH